MRADLEDDGQHHRQVDEPSHLHLLENGPVGVERGVRHHHEEDGQELCERAGEG